MTPKQEGAAVRRLYWGAFAVRCGVGLIAYALSSVFDLALMEDAGMYSQRASELAQAWMRGENSEWFVGAVESGRQAWFNVAVLAAFYLLFGGYEVIPVVIVVQGLLTAATPVLVYRVARRLGVPAAGAVYAGQLVAFSPCFVFWAGALYKEGVILIVLCLLFDHGLRLQERVSAASVGVVGLCVGMLFGMRFYIGAIMTVATVGGVLLGGRGKSGSAMGSVVQGVVTGGLVLGLFVATGAGDRVFEMVSLEDNLRSIDSSRRDLAKADSGYLRDVDVSTPGAAARFLPVGLAYFLTVPLPWQIGSYRQNLTLLETFYWTVVLYPLAVRGIARGWRTNSSGVVYLLTAALAVSVLYALFIGNIGTAYRVRVQVWVIVALFAGWGRVVVAEKRAAGSAARRATAARLQLSRPVAVG